MSSTFVSLGDVREGMYVVIEGEPCRVVEVTRAKTGKHGSAKAHVVAVGLFTGSKRTMVAPVDEQVEVPMIEKRTAQVIADLGDTIQLMDLETFETFELEKPDDPKLAERLRVGVQAEYWTVMGRRLIVRAME